MKMDDAFAQTFLENLVKSLEIPEVGQLFLATGFDTSSHVHFLRVARKMAAECRSFEEVVEGYRDALEEEINLDGPDVMNIVGVIGALQDHQATVEAIARDLPAAIARLRPTMPPELSAKPGYDLLAVALGEHGVSCCA